MSNIKRSRTTRSKSKTQ